MGTSGEQPTRSSALYEGSASVESSPVELTASQMAMASSSAGSDASPTLEPPEKSQGGGVTVWLSDKRVNALWSINQNRNSWMSVVGVGWRRLAAISDSGVVALTVLAAHAKQTQCRIDYREEADQLIHEIYVW
ncbi:MAG: hypothetical protein WCB68_09285 [Pyrinomonadaceae bacterium]